MHSPLTITRRAIRVLITSGLASLALLLGWAFDRLPQQARPQLVLMVYVALLATCVGAGIVAAVVSCHMTVGRAFSAGLRAGVGQVQGGFTEWDTLEAATERRLRSVN